MECYKKDRKCPCISKFSIVWSNLNRCDFNDGRPPSEIEKDLHVTFPILTGEIEILQPNVVIFFSGPYFDEHINQSFVGSQFQSVDGFSEREVARVVHDSLPQHSYRTYHPKYLRISGIEPKFIKYIEDINA